MPLAALEAALPVDIVLLPLHGAMVAEGYDECEPDIVSRAREMVGPDVKIGVERGVTEAALGMIWDPIAVKVAMSAGEGAVLDLRLGGKMGPMSGAPLDLRVTVSGIMPDMHQYWPQSEGELAIPCGDSVALHCRGIDIIVNSDRGQALSPTVFSNFGIDPASRRLLAVKSTQHFYAGFAPIAAEIIYMAGPGAIPPRFTEIPYQRVDRRKYPWVDDPFS